MHEEKVLEGYLLPTTTPQKNKCLVTLQNIVYIVLFTKVFLQQKYQLHDQFTASCKFEIQPSCQLCELALAAQPCIEDHRKHHL